MVRLLNCYGEDIYVHIAMAAVSIVWLIAFFVGRAKKMDVRLKKFFCAVTFAAACSTLIGGIVELRVLLRDSVPKGYGLVASPILLFVTAAVLLIEGAFCLAGRERAKTE